MFFLLVSACGRALLGCKHGRTFLEFIILPQEARYRVVILGVHLPLKTSGAIFFHEHSVLCVFIRIKTTFHDIRVEQSHFFYQSIKLIRIQTWKKIQIKN